VSPHPPTAYQDVCAISATSRRHFRVLAARGWSWSSGSSADDAGAVVRRVARDGVVLEGGSTAAVIDSPAIAAASRWERRVGANRVVGQRHGTGVRVIPHASATSSARAGAAAGVVGKHAVSKSESAFVIDASSVTKAVHPATAHVASEHGIGDAHVAGNAVEAAGNDSSTAAGAHVTATRYVAADRAVGNGKGGCNVVDAPARAQTTNSYTTGVVTDCAVGDGERG
jgi:hypothetical protein